MLDRRDLLVRTGLALGAGVLASAPGWLAEEEAEAALAAPTLKTWNGVRRHFLLRPDLVHMGTFLLAPHPKAVREAVNRHRNALDRNTVRYLQERGAALEAEVLRAAGAYLGAAVGDIALTDSTTMGLGTLYAGLDVQPGQELLSTTHDFFATHQALAWKAGRTGATFRRVKLYDPGEQVSETTLVARLLAGVKPQTRVVAVTWVHSTTGVKLPIRRIADALAEANAGRAPRDRALLCVDGVHGFGVENATGAALGCDFLVTGCHKWLFGPRGTGLVWGRSESWPAASPTIPSFSGSGTPGASMTPGGYHSFEHRWALAPAFRMHLAIGKARVERRVHALATQLKDGLAALPKVTVITPRSQTVSAGLVCFSVAGLAPQGVVERLRAAGIVATTTPYSPAYARLGPGILNTPADVRRTLAAVRTL